MREERTKNEAEAALNPDSANVHHEEIDLALESVVVTHTEFMALSALEGLEQFCGVELDASLPEDRREIGQILVEMVQKGELIPNDNDKEPFQTVPYLGRAFHILKTCERMAVLYPGRTDCPTKCIYPSDSGETLILQNSNINEKEIRLSVLSREEALESVWESFADTGCTLPEKEEHPEQELLPFDGRYRDAQSLCQREDVFLAVDKTEVRSGTVIGRCLLIEEGIFPWLLFQEQESGRKECPSREAVRKFLKGVF